jgi:hypothetical protein
LLSIHLYAATHWRAPELELAPEEAKRLADASAAVARHYPMMSSQKTADWSMLAMCATSVYAPRAAAIWHRTRSAPQPGISHNQGPPLDIPAAGRAVPPDGQQRPVTPGQLDGDSMAYSSFTAGSA